MYKLGIDIGGTKVNIGLLDEQASLVFKQTEQIPVHRDNLFILYWIKETLDLLLAKHHIGYEDIATCGIGVPGTVSEDGKVVLKLPNLGWENEPLAAQFESLTGVPTWLIQDSRAAALGEYLAGNGQGKQTVICVTLGTGIGTGIVIDGVVFNGALGGAGELGHVPVVPGGRECGCGKAGCLEKYVAGKGLAITVLEQLGSEYTVFDLFKEAADGHAKALAIIDEAVEMLGKALVFMVNLLSPDCLLFSGGLSGQKALYVDPLMAYINQNRYRISENDRFYMDIARLKEDAPMIGAALFPNKPVVRKPKLSASIMCSDMLHLDKELKEIEEAGIDYIHYDVMDGHFVPNLMLPMEMIDKMRQGTSLPFDIHLMTEKPENIIPLINLQQGDIVSVHWESTPHVQRAITLIKNAGAAASLALNPSTPIECARELLDELDMILVMTVNPGYSGQKLVPQSLDKITRMRKYLDELGYSRISIQVDGNCSFENVPKMHAAGADNFVVGTSSVFNPEIGMKAGARRLFESLE